MIQIGLSCRIGLNYAHYESLLSNDRFVLIRHNENSRWFGWLLKPLLIHTRGLNEQSLYVIEQR